MYQNQEPTFSQGQYLVGSPYFLNRLYFGSVGAEIWSSITLIYHTLRILLTEDTGKSFLTRLILTDSPVALTLMLGIGVAHFILLLLPNSRAAIIQRKILAALELPYWVYMGILAAGQGAETTVAAMVPLLILLAFSLPRKEY